MGKNVYSHNEIFFNGNFQVKDAIYHLIENKGGFYDVYQYEDNQGSSDMNTLADRANVREELRNTSTVDLLKPQRKFFSCTMANPKTPRTPRSNSTLLGIFQKEKKIITIEELWYRGLPNVARYCLWPVLIGN